ncbi:MAG: hypothetical protein ACI3ZN_04155, partial [Candidatus Cryptobacteroides sp.]
MITHPNVKINLGLNVLRKREDGFHDLETLFVPYFDIWDTLEIVSDVESETLPTLCGRYGNPADVSNASNASFDASDASDAAFSFVKAEDEKLKIYIARKEGVDWNPLADLCAKAYRLLDADFGLPPVAIVL